MIPGTGDTNSYRFTWQIRRAFDSGVPSNDKRDRRGIEIGHDGNGFFVEIVYPEIVTQT